MDGVGDKDREAVAARVRKAYDEGRISAADRDIRLGNVKNAASAAELELMNRDLDQLEATVPAAAPKPFSTFTPTATGTVGDGNGPRRLAIVIAVVLAVVLAGGGAIALFAMQISDTVSQASPAEPVPAEPPETSVTQSIERVPIYDLSGPGIRDFLAEYTARFHTTRVVDLTLYGNYVIVNVPVPGKSRQSGWLYRDGVWTAFGGVRATIPGARTVDIRRLDVAALLRNLRRARRTLHVEKPAQAYVIVRFMSQIDRVPSVDVYLTNKVQETGYLATTLDGQVVRTYASGQ